MWRLSHAVMLALLVCHCDDRGRSSLMSTVINKQVAFKKDSMSYPLSQMRYILRLYRLWLVKYGQIYGLAKGQCITISYMTCHRWGYGSRTVWARPWNEGGLTFLPSFLSNAQYVGIATTHWYFGMCVWRAGSPSRTTSLNNTAWYVMELVQMLFAPFPCPPIAPSPFLKYSTQNKR